MLRYSPTLIRGRRRKGKNVKWVGRSCPAVPPDQGRHRLDRDGYGHCRLRTIQVNSISRIFDFAKATTTPRALLQACLKILGSSSSSVCTGACFHGPKLRLFVVGEDQRTHANWSEETTTQSFLAADESAAIKLAAMPHCLRPR